MTRRQARHVRDGIRFGRRFATALQHGRRAAALGVLVEYLLGYITEAESRAFVRTVRAQLGT